MYYKAEAYIGSEYAGKILWENGLTPVYVSDNPVLNAQHVVFEAAKAYHYGLPYHVAMASVTSAPAELLGLGERIGKIKPGYDADIVVWDSDPMSVGATPVQVWIDGTAQFEHPVELEKPSTQPTVPDESLRKTPGEPEKLENVIFTGISNVLLPGKRAEPSRDRPAVVAVFNGKITCIGACEQEVKAASQSNGRIIHLKDGHLTKSFTALGSTIGLNEIDAEKTTDNGPSGGVFSRGVDGLALDNKKLHVANKYGVTRAISAPKFRGGATHYGTSVGFLTGAGNTLSKGAVWADDVAVHYTLTLSAKGDRTPSISSAVGAFRTALFEAVTSNDTITDPFSEKAYLKKVVNGTIALALTIHSADTIAAVLKLKSDVETAISSVYATSKPTPLRIVIIGGAESYLVATEIAAAKTVGVVLAPLNSYAVSWEERRALAGAPLTNGTAVDILVDAGVKVAIGLEEDWLVRDMHLLAGIAYKNGGGRLSKTQALDLISTNVYEMLGLDTGDEGLLEHFVIFEGEPLEIGGRIKAVGGGLGYTTVFG
jgi:hypothetical protein